MATALSFTSQGSQVTLSGRLEFAAHETWREMMQSLPPSDEITMDIAGVDDIDAAGLGLLLITHEDLGARGTRLALAGPNPVVRRVLEVSGFAGIVAIRD